MDTTPQTKSTILLVDDNPSNLEVLYNSLGQNTFEILISQDGESALLQAEQEQPDLILLDVLMPGLDGFETCRQLKANAATQAIPVIFMTALVEINDKLEGFEAGAVDYITKPLQPQEVVARVKTHLTLRRLQQQLQQEIASKDKLFAIIGHDLKGPIAALLDIISITAEHLDTYDLEKLQELTAIQKTAAENLHKLVMNLMTWSRMQRRAIEYLPQRFNLSLIVTRNINLLKPQVEQKQITVEQTLPVDLSVYADLDMVDMIMRNLLSNAMKFTRPGGRVNVSAITRGHEAEVAISDTGIGIPPKDRAKLFDISEKYKRKGTNKEEGTGLGLALCKDAVAMHGGRIWVESEVEQGTTVRFTLPTDPSQE